MKMCILVFKDYGIGIIRDGPEYERVKEIYLNSESNSLQRPERAFEIDEPSIKEISTPSNPPLREG